MRIVLENIEGITFNGVNLADELSDNNDIHRDYFIVNSVYGRGVIGLENELIYVAGMDGAYPSASRRNPRYLDVKITIKGNSFEHLRKKIERLNEILSVRREVEITFDDEKDRIYYGKIDAVDGDYETSCVYQTSITFLCSDPYKYSPEKTLSFPADIVTFNNNGTAEADPIFELTAKKKATFAMISNGDNEYNLIGKPADVDEQLVDEKTLIFSERGETLNTWTTAGTSVDGTVTGTMTTDGTGIVASDYGTSDDWHGPALMKEINPIKDFEVEMRMRVEATNPNQTYRIEFYLFDENMNVLGKMGLMDSSASRVQYSAEGRIGKFLGKDKNYLISSQNYQRNREHFHGMVRMRRIGRMFEFYVARIGVIDDFTHHDILAERFIDGDSEYQGKLKFVQIHIGKYGTTPNPPTPRINSIKVHELNEILVDQTPYILYPGDVVTFDHKDDDILINGEPRMDLKNFGGSFYKLKKGENMIIVTPEDTFDTKVTFRDKYL